MEILSFRGIRCKVMGKRINELVGLNIDQFVKSGNGTMRLIKHNFHSHKYFICAQLKYFIHAQRNYRNLN